MMRSCRLALTALTIASVVLGSATGAAAEEINHGEKLIEWLQSHGGYVNPKLEIRREFPDDPTSRFGMFTNGDLRKKEILLTIPRECVMEAEEDEDGSDAMNCNTVNFLIAEMRLGNDSDYAPYVNYLLAEPWGQLPSAWSPKGKRLLLNVLRSYTEVPLPPDYPVSWLENEWHRGCKGAKDPFEENASLMVVQRSWDELLIPVFDMMSHRNGHWLNTESSGVHSDTDVIVKTRRKVNAGEEIYTSYNMCEDCGGRRDSYGTFEIFRDYGFIEQYPRRFMFPMAELAYEIFEKEDTEGELGLRWISEEADEDDVEFLQQIEEAMEEVLNTEFDDPDEAIPESEIASLRQFVEATKEGVQIAIQTALEEIVECDDDDRTCHLTYTKYKDLTTYDGELDYQQPVCDSESIMEFHGYDIIDDIKTPYQHISTLHDPKNKDTCFDLDNIVQICSSYRPHYHEMMVHYPARFLKDVNRALFVGGGDSMLLHEILKYPNLESVVALELDQRVTRTSFKHFGTQPHWDDERVEWWFGDATKSLLMVPKEYFGSFDLVLVDLSETVMSFKVTGELDIMEALSLLLKPDGIMIKNELYFEAMGDIFQHTLQMHYFDVPVICSQAMILGSNHVNFMEVNLTDHGLDSKNLYIEPLTEDDHYKYTHDYAWHPDNAKHCKRENDELEQVSTEQSKSPGIIMIVEAEDATNLMKPLNSMKDRILKVLEDQGLTIVSTVVPAASNDDNVFVVLMKEGYVVSRVWFQHKYCAFDIHLWTGLEKHNDVKKALISAVGSSNTSSSSSSYRIVAGGMFGLPQWVEDEAKRGPRRTDDCNEPEKEIESGIEEGVIVEESLKFSKGKGEIVVVICGDTDKECKSADAVGRAKGKNVATLRPCSPLNSDSLEEMFDCEMSTLKLLQEAVSDGQKINALIFDSTATYEMGQILYNIFTKLKNRHELTAEEPTVIALSTNESDSWQENLVQRFRVEIFTYEPNFAGSIQYNGKDGNIDFHVATKDETFVQELKTIASKVEKRTGLKSNIMSLGGGLWDYDEDFDPPIYKPTDYDQTPPLEQFRSQKPLEHQTVFQLEGTTIEITTDLVKEALEKTLASTLDENRRSSATDVQVLSNVGDGCVLVALWSGGRSIILWDGRVHVDINLVTNEHLIDIADDFVNNFIENMGSEIKRKKKVPLMKTVLRDEQPRGFGRVVNYLFDVNSDYEPHWA